MTWALGWKRPSEIFHLTLIYGTENLAGSRSSTRSMLSLEQELGFRIELDWSSAEDEDQVALKLQSQLMVALPMPQDCVMVDLRPEEDDYVAVDMKVSKRRDPLKAIKMTKAVSSGQQAEGTGVLTRLLGSNLASLVGEGVKGYGDHWRSVSVLSICGCSLSVSFISLVRV